MPLHEVNNRFQAGRLFAQFDWKLCFMKAGPGLTCETASLAVDNTASKWAVCLPSFGGSLIYKAGLGSTCEMPLLAVDNHFLWAD